MTTNNYQLYLERSFLALPVAIVYLVFGLIGAPITFMLLRSTSRLFRTSTGPHLTICLGILLFDFTTSCVFIAMGLSYIIDGTVLALNKWYCSINDIFYVGCLFLSIWYVGLMSFERGLLIIHGISLPSKVWITIMMLELAFFLTINFICVARDDIKLVALGVYCMAAPEKAFGKVILYSYFTLMLLSVLATIYSYIGIAIVLRKRALDLYYSLNIDKDIALKRANRTIFKVLALLASYLVLNGIEIINIATEIITEVDRSPIADFTSICLLNINPIFNSILLITLHDSVRASLVETYPLLSKFSTVAEFSERNTT
ncbi:hypothetical protein CONCODRAFT_9858 [Conidiobolus coronatus NRRL 28638]|uniref:G-protein coupled receptors family 1 profile domain-containing protein n=1 Tax=Conidiobolus coronatus (strain ATCC 28846 / CBS 209.66 / NRRL 28638) TaxID=796925 RepID=A0A137NYU3_CONC2|nr:hypothetical protein CONCODRAFT_9858 [Conidiobolus coronatus NRRL 28638]|eukprot:KXN68000.1 hypothetical protein CONCODRAFT_9858 [Conidiobolus coronatus NRRL 28638]